MLLVQWVRHTAGQRADLVVHPIMASVSLDQMQVVQAIVRRLYKVFIWYRANVDLTTLISLSPDQVFRSVSVHVLTVFYDLVTFDRPSSYFALFVTLYLVNLAPLVKWLRR